MVLLPASRSLSNAVSGVATVESFSRTTVSSSVLQSGEDLLIDEREESQTKGLKVRMVAKRLWFDLSLEVGVAGYFSFERGEVFKIEVALPIVELLFC